MRITYANSKVKRYFDDYSLMKKKLPSDWVRSIKKHIDRLKAAETFADFLTLNLGHPEPLKGSDEGKYSLRVAGNVRLIIQPEKSGKEIRICEVVRVEGVVDYHGSKKSWYIS